MDDEVRLLHVDDEPEFTDLTATFLEREDDSFDVETATSVSEGIEPDLPFVLFTGQGSEEIASDAISAGVTDYLQKGNTTDQYPLLANRIRNAVDRYRSKRALEASRKRLSLSIEQSPLGVLEYNKDFEIRDVEVLGDQ